LPIRQWHLFNIIETIEAELGGELTAIQQYKIKQQAKTFIAQGITNEDDLAGEVAFWFAANGI
jgi:hypothetical protein